MGHYCGPWLEDVPSDVKRLSELMMRRSRFTGYQAQNIISQLDPTIRALEIPDNEAESQRADHWAATVTPLFDKPDSLLRELDRQINVGAYV
jgi:hypothetical protein